ncbi:MAG: hypothetical protein LBI69_02145 [Puniceicoccales bacterium]|nr:hypothetical protein [Puniceicoccales bacterium]
MAFFLDQFIPRGSFLLGLSAVFPFLFFSAFSTPVAAIFSFFFGLTIDSIYLPLPFGLSAFYGVFLIFFQRTFSRIFPREVTAGRLSMVLGSGIVYYLMITCIAPAAHCAILGFVCAGSIVYNMCMWRIWTNFTGQ